MTPPDPASRYHALDGLRGFAMLLGVVLHAAVSVMAVLPAFWPVRDARPTAAADLLVLAVHDFRMQLFFLLCGFFSGMLTRRRGVRGMVRHRLLRVGVPFAVGLATIVPAVRATFVYAEVDGVLAGPVRGDPSFVRAYAEELVAADPGAGPARLTAESFRGAAWVTQIVPGHLWFLYYLLLFVAAAAALAPLARRLRGTRALAAVDAAFRRIVAGRGRIFVLTAATVPLMATMRWVVDTAVGWPVEWHVAGYYFLFFAFGWMLDRHRDLVPAFGRGWGVNLAVANLAVLPVMAALVVSGAGAERAGADATGERFGAAVASACYTWLMVAGLWGAALRWLGGGAGWVRYAADASYWCYLASLPVVVAGQCAVRDWPVPGAAKVLIVSAGSLLVLFASYEWLVRYTLVGAVLNGRKARPARG